MRPQRFRWAAAALLPAAALVFAHLPAHASSHREAPFITAMPKVDATDLYAFRSYESGRSGFVTLIANYYPFQDPFGGPNYFSMDPDAVYEIHVDNNGDVQEDLTFQFRFKNPLSNNGEGGTVAVNGQQVAHPLKNAGQITVDNNMVMEPGLNVQETYTVNVVRGNRRTGQSQAVVRTGTQEATFDKPLDNAGQKTFPGATGYADYANRHVFEVDIPGCTPTGNQKARVFVGQRNDPFRISVGRIFDLINYTAAEITDADRTDLTDDLQNKNVTSLAIEVPIACLTRGTTGAEAIIGVWTTASLPQARVLNPSPTYANPARSGGPLTQVSRLGMPLVNEVVIGLKDKNRFNSSQPKDDAQFLPYVATPTLPELVETLFTPAVAPAPNVFPRADLVAVFLTGVEGVNKASDTPGEMLRLNTSLPATTRTDDPTTGQNNLGAAGCFTRTTENVARTLNTSATGCDPAGFPNGRRPGDDVVDIALRVVMGYLLPKNQAGSSDAPFTDGVLIDESQSNSTFPYLLSPLAGSP
jgi:hypothetical protein